MKQLNFEDIAPTFIPSKYQQDVFDFIKFGNGHGIINAVAGSGKTTTLIKCLDCLPAESQSIICCFNSHIAEELKISYGELPSSDLPF